MSRFARAAFSLIASSLLLGCEHPENYRWAGEPSATSDIGSSLPSEFEWKYPSVAVYSFATPPKESPASLSLKDLSDRGQQSYIENLLRHGAKPDDIRAAIAKPLSAGTTPEGTAKVEGKYDRTIVATVTKGLLAQPGDRLMWTWIVVQPRNFRFTGYTVIATDNQVLNIEHVQNQTTATLQGQGAIAPSLPIKPTVGITGSVSNQYTTSADINEQYTKLSADILPYTLRIYRESERNLDVVGNTLISLTTQVEPDLWNAPAKQDIVQRVSKLTLTKDGKLLGPSAITIETTVDKAPPHCPLIADVSLVYQIRRVVSGSESYVEGEQHVSIEQHRFSSRSPQTIVSADEARRPAWQILGADNRVIKARDVFGRILPLSFADYEQARNFAAWMDAHREWIKTNKSRNLGKAGLRLDTGDETISFPSGPFYAAREPDPDNIETICAAMNRRDPQNQIRPDTLP